MMKSKIKVNTSELLEAVKERRSAMEREHQKKIDEYTRNAELWPALVQRALEKAGRNLNGLHWEQGYRGEGCYLKVPVPTRGPEDPGEFENKTIDRLIRSLEMAADDVIVISSDDAAMYLG